MTRTFARLACAAAVALIAGCSGSKLEGQKVDYKSASQTRPLEVPPDLAAPQTSDRFALPDAPERSTATYSEYAQERPGQAQPQGVLPKVGGARVERAGTQRWLVVDLPAEALWPQLREFWQEMGFILAIDDPQLGIMETDWAENRAKIPPGAIRSVLGKWFDPYSAPERDRFRTRVERGAQGKSTEIYVSHRGAYEMYVADANMRQTGRIVWQARPPDPDLEAEMLARLMVKLGTPPDVAAREIKAGNGVPRALLSKVDGQPVLVLKDDFEHGWRRVGLSLDRLGFAVQDRDRAAGVYYVRYLNPSDVKKEEGFLSKLTFWDKGEAGGKAADYRIAVKEAQAGTRVSVQAQDGKPERSAVATRILTVLLEDLK